MSTYRNKTTVSIEQAEGRPALTARDFRGQLQEALNRHIGRGANGFDANAHREGRNAENLITRNFWMDESVIALACRMHSRFSWIDPRAWVFWMVNSEVTDAGDCVTVRQMSGFYNQHTAKNFGKELESFFSKPMRFVVDPKLTANQQF